MPITMPGLASNMHTDEMIKKLVEVERQPIVRLEKEKKLLNLQEKIWQSFKGELKHFDMILKKLYSFSRVFKDKTIDGDVKDYLSAMVSPKAENSEHTINIKQLAKAHKIITDSININDNIPKSEFTIKIGERSKHFKFNGGSIKRFARFLKSNASDLIKVDFIRIDSEHYKMSIASKFTGKKNSIDIIPDSDSDRELFNKLGLVKIEAENSSYSDNFTERKAGISYSDIGYNDSSSLYIQPKSDLIYNLPAPVKNKKNIEIEFYYLVKKHINKNTEDSEINNELKSAITKNIGSVTIKDVTIKSAEEILNTVSEEKKKKSSSITNETVKPMEVLFYSSDGKFETVQLSAVSNWTAVKKKIDSLEDIKYIKFKNINNQTELYADNLKIISKSGELAYKNEITKPQDAKVVIDDVPIERANNTDLKDIIDGVTLNLKRKTPDTLTFKIVPDKEKIKKKVKEFVEQYNNIIDFINIAGKTSSSTKPGENDKKKKERGALSNDMALMNIKSKLRSTVMSRFDTSLGDDLSILAQVGITTGAWGSSWENIRQGFLQFDESKFDLALDKWGEKTGEIFGYDSNKDKIIDTGVAYKLSVDIKPFIQLHGVIDGKINLAKTLAKSKEKIIASKEDRLEEYRNKLKDKFTRMEEALNKLNGKSQALQNQLNSLGSGNNKEK